MTRIIFLTFSLVIIFYAAYLLVRTHILTRNSAELQREALQFPTTYSLGSSSNPSLSLVILGDSTAVGVGATSLTHTMGYQLATTFANQGHYVEVTNYAQIGAVLSDVVSTQAAHLKGTHVALIFISISANDATQNTDPPQFKSNLAKLLELPADHIFLTTTPNFKNTPALPYFIRLSVQHKATTLAQAIGQFANQQDKISLVDLYQAGTL